MTGSSSGMTAQLQAACQVAAAATWHGNTPQAAVAAGMLPGQPDTPTESFIWYVSSLSHWHPLLLPNRVPAWDPLTVPRWDSLALHANPLWLRLGKGCSCLGVSRSKQGVFMTEVHRWARLGCPKHHPVQVSDTEMPSEMPSPSLSQVAVELPSSMPQPTDVWWHAGRWKQVNVTLTHSGLASLAGLWWWLHMHPHLQVPWPEPSALGQGAASTGRDVCVKLTN